MSNNNLNELKYELRRAITMATMMVALAVIVSDTIVRVVTVVYKSPHEQGKEVEDGRRY